jgi:hypothetical protein
MLEVRAEWRGLKEQFVLCLPLFLCVLFFLISAYLHLTRAHWP